MKTNDELIADQMRTEPEFCAKWERTVLARAVAVAILRYRSEHDLSQRDLAERLRMKQPQVARLELGEVNPNIDTLMRISAALGIELTDRRAASGSSGSECREASAGQQCCRLGSDRRRGTRRPRSLGIALLVHMFLPQR